MSDPAPHTATTPTPQEATFAGGCFWCTESDFDKMPGVLATVSGYIGGRTPRPTYEQVSAGGTDHIEAVRVTYDPARIRYDQLLRVFFAVGADPTQLNYQGPDHGSQYRNALVPMDKEQARVAAAYLGQLKKSGLWKQPIVTTIEPYKAFYPAEGYHQDFAANNPDHGYIKRWDAPKVANLKRLFPDLYKAGFTRN